MGCCFSTPTPKTYRIRRTESREKGITDIPRKKVERYLDNAPHPPGKGKRYPKSFENREGLFFNPNNNALWEYPTKEYPYNQNSKGKAFITGPDGLPLAVDAGYIRTITDNNKNIQGVVNHPWNKRFEHERAQEIYGNPFWPR